MGNEQPSLQKKGWYTEIENKGRPFIYFSY